MCESFAKDGSNILLKILNALLFYYHFTIKTIIKYSQEYREQKHDLNMLVQSRSMGSKECFLLRWCLVGLISFLVAMQIVSQGYIIHDDLVTDSSLSIVKKLLALVSTEREFFSVHVKMRQCKYFSIKGLSV